MDYTRITCIQIEELWELQKAYKAEIEEDPPSDEDKIRLKDAIEKNRILFFGAWNGSELVGCCSVTLVFSTFQYATSGVFEDFYIRPVYRHRGVARKLIECAFCESGVASMTVGCADCDMEMYKALGFSSRLGNLLVFG